MRLTLGFGTIDPTWHRVGKVLQARVKAFGMEPKLAQWELDIQIGRIATGNYEHSLAALTGPKRLDPPNVPHVGRR